MTVTDDPEEEAKQRTFKGILNKLTPDNFERLSQQLLDVGITEAKTLIGLIAQVCRVLCRIWLGFEAMGRRVCCQIWSLRRPRHS
jgi:hypothetical protein